MLKCYCPLCQATLVLSTKNRRYECPTKGCDFQDRRKGHTMVDETRDRRGGSTWISVGSWRQVDMNKYFNNEV